MTTTEIDQTTPTAPASVPEPVATEQPSTPRQHPAGYPELALADAPPRRGRLARLRAGAGSHPVVTGSLAGVLAVGGAFGAGYVVGQDAGAASAVTSVTSGVTDQLGPGGATGDPGTPPDMGARPDRGTVPDQGTAPGTDTGTGADDATTDSGVTDGTADAGA